MKSISNSWGYKYLIEKYPDYKINSDVTIDEVKLLKLESVKAGNFEIAASLRDIEKFILELNNEH